MSLSWLAALRPRLEELCAGYGVPLGVAVGWIEVESGGRLHELTSLDERGYWSIHPDESHDLHFDHQRLSTDADYSLLSGFKLVDYYRKIVLGLNVPGLTDGSEFHWLLAKFLHAMGIGAASAVVREAAHASACADWDTFAAYCRRQDATLFLKLRHSPAKWVGNVERVREIGRPYGLDVLACMPPQRIA